MTREIRLFVLAAVLPALLGVAAGAWSVRTAWRKMVDDERGDLRAQAELLADALMGRIHAAGLGGGPASHGGPPGSRGAGPGSRRPPAPRHLKESNRSSLPAEQIAPICAQIRPAGAAGATAFELRNLDGSRFLASDGWPERHDLTGACDLGPPLGDKTLVAARADGGAAFRFRARLLFAVAGAGSVLLALAVLAGGLALVRTIRRERRDARAKADFFDNVSHELRTPLAGIRLNAELLARDRIPDPELRRGAFEAILVESDRLGRMVEELLEFGRLAKGTHRYRLETFDLAAFALDPAELQGAAGASQGRATVRAVGPGALVLADKNAIRQIGVALVSNAVKYAEGPIEIEVEGAEARYLDRGPGVPRGDEERIFERFRRGDDSLAARVPGSGLGLAIARALARGMGCDLRYSHRPDGGSCFTLSLPRAPSSP